MDYERKYKEALENAKQEYITTKNVERKQWLEELFPELKESEDELTWLTQFIQEEVYNLSIDIRDNEDRIKLKNLQKSLAWLEKQSESIKIRQGRNYLCTKTHKYAGVEWIEGIKYYSPEDYSLVNQGCTYHCPKYSKEEHNNFFKEVEYDDCVEKQGGQKPIINIAYMVSEYASTPEQGNEGFGKPMNCMVRAYRQGILDTLKKMKQNNVVEEQQNITECEPQKFGSEGKDIPNKHQWEDGDIIRLKKDDGVRWQIFKSPESEMLEGWFMSQIMENGIAGGYVNSFILDAKYEFLHNPCKEFLKKC